MPAFSDFYEVIIPRPVRKTFTYGWIAREGKPNPAPGCLVKVPFGKASLQGIIIKKLSFLLSIYKFNICRSYFVWA